MNSRDETSAFVLGLDGVPWELIDRWSESGALPTFARLREEGAAGPLTSTTPASTPLAWPSIATGTWPDKHGLYWFRHLESDHTHRVNTSRDISQPTLWEILEPAVVGNVPMTYPAIELDGAMVTGMMSASRHEGFTSPPELADEIAEQIPEYEIGLDWMEYDGDSEAFLADFDGILDARIELLELLLSQHDPRLFFFVFTEPDRLQHLTWDEDVLLEYYRRLDDVLATVLECTQRRSMNLFIVSDHGFGPVSTIVSGNRVLEEAGYLSRKANTGTRGLLERVGVTKEGVRSWLATAGIDEERLIESLPQGFVDVATLQIPGDRALYDVDYDETMAFIHGDGCLYVNDTERFETGIVDPDEVENVKEEVRAILADVVDPDTGTRVLEVHDGAAVYPNDDHSPDLVVEGVDGYEVQTSLTDSVFHEAKSKAAGHRSEGILLAHGPDIGRESTPDAATVVDVAPTLLHLCGEPVPEAGDGRVLSEIIAADSPTADTAVRTAQYSKRDSTPDDSGDSNEDVDGDVEQRLRGLGYID